MLLRDSRQQKRLRITSRRAVSENDDRLLNTLPFRCVYFVYAADARRRDAAGRLTPFAETMVLYHA